MENAQRWSVTYTKHVTQKRKVYQDGFLELQSSRRKVVLYDEWDKLLESRFVKKDDVMKSGETLKFDSYLVDIGELCGSHKPMSTSSCQEKDGKEKESLHNYYSQKRKPVFGNVKGRVINLSPSEKVIRDFRKHEMNKGGSSPSCMDMKKTSTTEWQVLYTTQIIQNVKKFQDGFLQLLGCGSQGRQIMLFDATRRHLESRFLRKDEIVCTGESLAFEGHLVDIGEQQGDQKPASDSSLLGKDCKIVGKTNIADHQDKIPTNNKFHADKTSPGKLTNPNNLSSWDKNAKLSWVPHANEPRRAVHDILSILRKPITVKVASMNKTLVEKHLELHSSDAHSDTKNHIKEYAEDCTESAQEELSEKNSDHDCRIKVLKPENVEVLSAAENWMISENGREFQAGSGPTNCTPPILSLECTNHNELVSNSSMEPYTLITALDSGCQKPTKSETLTRSNEQVEPVKPPEISSCEKFMTEANAAATDNCSSKLPNLWESKKECSSRCKAAASSASVVASNDCSSHDLSGVQEEALKLHTKEMDDLPSFDLGF